MKQRLVKSREHWLENFKNHVLENTYWGKVAYLAKLMLASAIIKNLINQRRNRY